ncbi:MAG: hypothetical protein ABL308_10585 [Oceanicaulis sp.]
MASHRSTSNAPADDQAFQEIFDEDKAANDAEIGRPDRDKEDERVQPVDQALTGARGERFGVEVRAEGSDPGRQDEDERRERAAEEAAEDDVPVPNGPASDTPRKPTDTDVKHTPGQTAPKSDNKSGDDGTMSEEERLDEAMKETFPASDPPPTQP